MELKHGKLTKIRINNYVDGNGLSEEIGQMFQIRKKKNRNNVIREKLNIKNSVVDYVRYKQLKLVWPKKGSLEEF